MGSPTPFVVDCDAVESFSPPHHSETSSKELLNPERGSEDVVFRVSTLGPGGHDHWHAHADSEQLFFVLSGRATLSLDELGTGDIDDAVEHELSPESFVYLPRETHHELHVTGDEPFRTLVIWAPPYESFDEWDPEA